MLALFSNASSCLLFSKKCQTGLARVHHPGVGGEARDERETSKMHPLHCRAPLPQGKKGIGDVNELEFEGTG